MSKNEDFRLKAAEEMSKEIRHRFARQMYSIDDKEAVEKFIRRKQEDSDHESKRLEAETKKTIDDLKSLISRAGRNNKVDSN